MLLIVAVYEPSIRERDMQAEESLIDFAREEGASLAKLIKVEDIGVNPGVRMKCWIPICRNYAITIVCD